MYFVGKSSTYLVKVSIITRIYLNFLKISIGPIVSIAIRCIGFKVSKTKRDALIALWRMPPFLGMSRGFEYIPWRHALVAARILLSFRLDVAVCANVRSSRAHPFMVALNNLSLLHRTC